MNSAIRIFTMIAVLAIGATGNVIATIRQDAPAYPNAKRRVFERPSFYVQRGEFVEILQYSEPLSHIRTRSGRTGWVQANRIDTAARPPILSLRVPSPDAVPKDSVAPDTTPAPVTSPVNKE